MDKLSWDPPKFSIVKWQSSDVIEFRRDLLPPPTVRELDGTPAGPEEVEELEKDPH
jgi:hypothetical protein